jgi:hypothetical protein
VCSNHLSYPAAKGTDWRLPRRPERRPYPEPLYGIEP